MENLQNIVIPPLEPLTGASEIIKKPILLVENGIVVGKIYVNYNQK